MKTEGVKRMTIGGYLGYLSSVLEKEPSLANQELYTSNGILYGWEDSYDLAKRLEVPEVQVREWVNDELIEGVRSNDHLIVPPGTKRPEDPFDFLLNGSFREEKGERL